MKKGNSSPANRAPSDIDAAARRRILKGLASVPAIATLASGSARAATSNLQCIGATTPTVNPNTPNGSPTFDCKDPSQTQEYLSSGVFYDPSEALPAARKTKPSGPGNGQDCVIFVDANGQNETFDATVGQTAVTPSCYTSFV